jgi:Ca2+-binding EF-hand superfamily protein
MYRHAKKVFTEKSRLSANQARHVVALTRISASLRKTGSMVCISEPPTHEIVLPSLPDDDDDVALEATYSITLPPLVYTPLPMIRRSCSNLSDKPKELDPHRLAELAKRVENSAETDIPDRETVHYRSRAIASRAGRDRKRQDTTQAAQAILEKRLAASIKICFSTNTDDNAVMQPLTTRVLLPFYKLSDVRHFLEIFQKYDQDYSGDLDAEEWCNFFVSLNKAVSRQQARAIFTTVDTNCTGFLRLNDLVPVIFNDATKDQQRLILKYAETEISKRKIGTNDMMKEQDLETLFEFYDENDAGFLAVGFVRERVSSVFSLPEAALWSIFDPIKDMEDDEMINLSEFCRLFRPYLIDE